VTTSYRVVDQTSYEETVDDGTGAKTHLVMGRAPRPRYRSSSWTRMIQVPAEVVLDDPLAEAWFGQTPEVLTVDWVQNREELLAVARRRRSRKLAHVHTVVRPVCSARPGDTVLLVDPRTGILHRCLVTRLAERWTFDPRPQVLATYTLEQPL
jgi:hypothetical protein